MKTVFYPEDIDFISECFENESNVEMKRKFEISLKALKAGAENVYIGNDEGVFVNDWILISHKFNGWSYKKVARWMEFKNLESLLKKQVTDRPVKCFDRPVKIKMSTKKLDEIFELRAKRLTQQAIADIIGDGCTQMDICLLLSTFESDDEDIKKST